MKTEKGLRLKSLLNYDNAFKLTKLLAVLSIICASVVVIYVIDKFSNKVYVIDRSGIVAEAKLIDRSLVREWEYEDLIKRAFNLVFANNYKTLQDNIELSLEYFSERTQEYIIDHVERYRFEQRLKDGGATTNIVFTKLNINMNTIPVTGNLELLQTISAEGVESKYIKITTPFIITDAPQTRQNIHGAEISGLDLNYSKPNEDED